MKELAQRPKGIFLDSRRDGVIKNAQIWLSGKSLWNG
jgi:hypothetical protein